ncbi:GNAT family N-acetyltransferase [Stomatohabitans albus]|uniref:GNAT family N-acetyltransferase n=1 Tax=Stomatohabitans albus TaxID=3110766 RepID=UPI00300CEF61
MTYEIRVANPEEYDIVSSLVIDAYADLAAIMSPDAWSSFAHDIANVNGRVADGQQLVCLEGDKIVGTLTMYQTWQGAQADAIAIRLVAVDTEHRMRGVARAMINGVINQAKALGKKRVVCTQVQDVVLRNEVLNELGFEREPSLDHQPAPGVHAYGYSITV